MLKSRTSQTGAQGEEIACIFLKRKGFRIIERNFRKPWGEIDIIAEKDGIVRIIEVKSITTIVNVLSREIDYRPEELVTRRKLLKVARTAALYMEQKKDNREYQVDVVGVLMDQGKRTARCRFFEQALEENI